MRDYAARLDDDYDDTNDEDVDEEPSARRGLDGEQTLAMLGALALIAAPAFKSLSRRWRLRHPVAASETSIDRFKT